VNQSTVNGQDDWENSFENNASDLNKYQCKHTKGASALPMHATVRSLHGLWCRWAFSCTSLSRCFTLHFYTCSGDSSAASPEPSVSHCCSPSSEPDALTLCWWYQLERERRF